MGLLLAFIATCFQSSKDLLSKRLAFSIVGSASAFASFAFALPFYLLLLLVLWASGYETFALSSSFLAYVMLRSITDTGAEWTKMAALRQGDISLVVCFFSMTPLFLLFISPLVTGDSIPTTGILGVLVTVLGTLVIVYSPGSYTGGNLRGIGLATLSAFFFSLNTCFDRLAVKEASPTLSGFAMTLLSAMMLAPLVMRSREAKAGMREHARPFLARGFFEVAFMVTKLWSLQYLPAQYVAGIQRLAVLFSIVGGRVFYKEKQFTRRMIGAMIIVLGVGVITFSAAK